MFLAECSSSPAWPACTVAPLRSIRSPLALRTVEGSLARSSSSAMVPTPADPERMTGVLCLSLSTALAWLFVWDIEQGVFLNPHLIVSLAEDVNPHLMVSLAEDVVWLLPYSVCLLHDIASPCFLVAA